MAGLGRSVALVGAAFLGGRRAGAPCVGARLRRGLALILRDSSGAGWRSLRAAALWVGAGLAGVLSCGARWRSGAGLVLRFCWRLLLALGRSPWRSRFVRSVRGFALDAGLSLGRSLLLLIVGKTKRLATGGGALCLVGWLGGSLAKDAFKQFDGYP